ncbi:MAG: hypothetical protein WB347_24960, partial [Terriglobales bacterium]
MPSYSVKRSSQQRNDGSLVRFALLQAVVLCDHRHHARNNLAFQPAVQIRRCFHSHNAKQRKIARC